MAAVCRFASAVATLPLLDVTPRARDSYNQPSDPWGDAERWDGDPAGREQQYGYGGGSGYHAQPEYGGYAGHGGGGYDGGGYDGGQPGYSGYDVGQPRYGGFSDQPGYAGHGYGGGQDGGGYGEAYQIEPAPYGTTYGSARVGEDPYPAPPERSSTRLIATIVAVLAVLVVGGVVTAFVVTNQEEKPSAAPSADPANQGGGADGGTERPRPERADRHAGARVVGRGQVRGQGSVRGQRRHGRQAQDADRGLRPRHLPGTARFDGTTDYATECGKVKGYQFHYFFDSELNALDFVLCLKQR